MRRAARTIFVVVAAILGAAVLAALAGRVWLETAAGERWLARQLAAQVSGAIAGELRVERVELEGLRSAVATGVELRAPDGTVAARAERVEAAVALATLLSPHKVVERLEVGGLALELVGEEERGYAIARALEPTGPEEAEPGGGGVSLEEVRIEIDRFAVVPSPGAAPSFAAEDGVAEGRLETGAGGIQVEADARFALRAPVEGPARAEVSGSIAGGRIELERLDATLPGGARVRARSQAQASGAAAVNGGALGELEVSADVPPGGLVPLGGPAIPSGVALEGDFSQRGDGIALDVVLRPSGPGEIRVDGWIGGGAFEVTVDARGIDPARLAAGAPRGRLWAALEASGTTGDPARLAGRLWIAPSRLRGVAVGPGRARVRVADGRVAARGIALDIAGAHASGSLALGGAAAPAADLRLTARALERLAPALHALGVELPPLAGALEAHVVLRGRGGSRRVAVEARSERLVVDGRVIEGLALEARLAGRTGSVDLAARTDGRSVAVDARGERVGASALRLGALSLRWGEASWRLARTARIGWGGGRLTVDDLLLDGTGEIALETRAPLPGAPRAAPLRVDLRVDALPLAPFRALLPEGLPDGALSLGLALRGTAARPEVRASGTLALAPEDREEIEVAVELEGSRATLAAAATARLSGAPVAEVRGTLRSARRGPLWDPAVLRASRVDASLEVPAVELARLRRLGILPLDARGELVLALRATGALRDVEVAGDVRVSGLAVEDPELGKLPPLAAELRLDAGREIVVRADAAMPGAPPARAHLRVRRSLGALLEGARGDTPFEARVEVELGPLDFPRVPARAPAVALRVEAAGTFDAPRARVHAEAEGLELRGEALGAAWLDASIAPGLATAEVRLAPAEGGSLLASARLAEGAPWEAEIVADDARLSLVEALPRLAAIEGAVVDGALRVRGGPRPTARGRVTLDAARVSVPGFATFREIALRLEAERGSLVLERLAASLGDGRVEARGRARLSGEDGEAELHVESDGFPVPIGPRPVGALTTEIDVKAGLAGELVTGSVRVAPGELRLPDGLPGELHPVSLPSDVVVHEPGEDAGEGEPSPLAAWLDALRARIEIALPRDFWVRSEAANLEVSGDLVARWDGERLAFTGDILVPRGTVTVIRRRFEVERLALGFRGDPDVDPSLDGRLVFDQPTVDVLLALSGSLRDPELELTSDPPMPAADVAALIATGGGGPAEAGVSGAVLSGALNFVAGQVGEAVAANLPIDVLAVDVGPGGEARRVEAGAYVTPRLFVSFVRNLLAEPDENTHEVQAEYELLRRLTLMTRYGDRESGGVDLLWERRFPSPKQRRQAREGPQEEGEPVARGSP